MAYWEWNSSYEIGINVIDRQHERLVSYINELHEAMITKNHTKVPEVLAALYNYTVSHFAYEEALMEQAGYTLIEPHKKVHESFIKTIGMYAQMYKNDNDISGKLMAELQIWLTNHILHDDKDYSESVKEMIYNEKIKKTNPPKKEPWYVRIFR